MSNAENLTKAVFGFLAAITVSFAPPAYLAAQDAKPPYAGDSLLTAPKPFAPGLVLGSAPAFTPDGCTVYTHLYKENVGHTIYVSRFIDGVWTPSRVAEFSGQYDELEPCLSADGAQLLFFSFRPVGDKNVGGQIWVMDKSGDGWGEPRPLGATITAPNSASGVPSLAKNGNLYFGLAGGGRWPWEIFYARFVDGKYAQPENINDQVNQGFLSWSHCIAPDESLLFYVSDKPGGYGDIDLYVSFKENGKWRPGKNLGAIINTDKAEVWPRLSPDGKYLFFKHQGDETGYIYQIDVKPLLDALAD